MDDVWDIAKALAALTLVVVGSWIVLLSFVAVVAWVVWQMLTLLTV